MIVEKTFYVEIAGFSVKVNFYKAENEAIYIKTVKNFEKLYNHFFTERKKPNAVIEIKINDYLKTVEIQNEYYVYYLTINGNYYITYYDVLNFHLIFRTILQHLLQDNNGFFIHASAIQKNNRVELFMGKSNAGKSTIIKTLKTYYKAFADDTVIVRKIHNTFVAYQAPFLEKQKWITQTNKGKVISSCYLLRKSRLSSFESISLKDVQDEIFQHVILAKKNKVNIQLVKEFITSVRFLNLFVNTNKSEVSKLMAQA